MKSNTGIQIYNSMIYLNYLIIISFISISSSIGTSEEELKVHFKEKHKINTVKPFLIKRICRICEYDKSSSNDELVKLEKAISYKRDKILARWWRLCFKSCPNIHYTIRIALILKNHREYKKIQYKNFMQL